MEKENRINVAELEFRSDVKGELFILAERIVNVREAIAKMEEMVKENKRDITGVAKSLRDKIDKTERELQDDIIERTKSSNTKMYEVIKAAGLALIGGLIGHYGVKR